MRSDQLDQMWRNGTNWGRFESYRCASVVLWVALAAVVAIAAAVVPGAG